jgi:hypothetical protein
MKFDTFAQSLGIAFVPVDRQTKNPYHGGWPQRTFRASDFRPDDNVGAKWGDPSGGLVDIDCDSHAAARVAERLLEKAPRYGRRSKRGSHYILRAAGAKTKQFINPFTKEMVIELRSTGSQSVLPGSIHPSGEPYEWEQQVPPPTVDPLECRQDVGQLAAIALTASLWAEGSRHGFALALAGFLAKQRVPKERTDLIVELVAFAADDKEVRDRLAAVATTYERFENGDEITANFTDVLNDKAATFAATLAKWLALEREAFRIRDEGALLAREAAPFLVKNIVVRGSLVAIVAPPDVGKTFLTLDLCLTVASGQSHWLGQRVLESGPVVYVMAEGAGRFKLRYLAWKQTRGVKDRLPFHWIDQAVPLLDEKVFRDFAKQVAQIKPRIVVFDTLSRCLMGADENSQSDMGKAVGSCDELRARTGAVVALVHHTKKDGTTERGSSVLRASVDTILTLKEDADERGLLKLACERQKDAEPFTPMDLVRRPIELEGVWDDEGNPESSCVLEVADSDDAQVRRAEKADKIREAIVTLVRSKPDCSRNYIVEKMGGNRNLVLSRIKDLVEEGLLLADPRKGLRALDLVREGELVARRERQRGLL